MKKTAISVLAVSAGLLMGGSALAQTRCGASYTVEPGDTLYGIAQQCRVTMSRIMRLNPGLEPRDMAVGSALQLAARDAAPGDSAPRERYRVEAGDTMFSIAQALGVSLIELLDANTDLDPFALEIGEVIEVPGDDGRPAATVGVAPRSGEAGTPVTVRADGLRPDDWVTIGVGPQASEWEAVEAVRVAEDGEVAEDVRVPGWAEPGDDLIFVVDTDRGYTFKSGVFNVTDGAGPGGEPVALEGRVRRGAECYTLRTPDGDLWSLVSDDVRFTAGEYVEVEGERADASFCMQGIGTVEVAEIEEVAPPR
ncbi:LysM peptidoglycan-binding domain-containing protein [Aquibium sp. A9E412]|uniref:LysM peptidoglycan-binding domain-containing protein n=1 Tax=Aquibium sp. A9E412 TaxID=2976767 RepID=UPI0025B102E2|nr:LysM peptidoglycan-binding domain-containing protein [Aquibium sp. A9E412]MDN2567710.1 LysM peptidoglycan-binding domain-containing protein [Aquibium sp. A9E412]